MARKPVALGLLMMCIVQAPFVRANVPHGSARGRAVPVGEVVAHGHVFVNGVRVTSGSTVFEGGRVRTSAGANAILVLRAGAGVIAVLPESEASVGTADGVWAIELARGTILIRARQATEVLSGRARVRAPQGNLYRVTRSEEGVRVEALERPAAVRVGGQMFPLAAGQSLFLREDGAVVAAATPSPQPPRARRRVVIPALVIGALAVTLALTVARGERSKVVSPVAPQR